MRAGVIVPLVTPVTADGAVADEDVARLVATVAEHVVALVPALSTGEGWALDDDRWTAMVAATVRHANGLPVLAGIQCATTEEVVARAWRACDLGSAGVVVSTPAGPDVSQERMYQHFAEVTDAVPAPVVVYHESAVSGNRLDTATLLRICALPGVVAVKDSGGDPVATRALLAAAPPVAVWQGLEHLVTETSDVDGWVLALANLEPELCARAFAGSTHPAELVAACARYRLTESDWHRHVKNHLCRRGVITTPLAVTPTRGGTMSPTTIDTRAGLLRELFLDNRSVPDAARYARIERAEAEWIVPLVARLEQETPRLSTRAEWLVALDGMLAKEKAGSPSTRFIAEEATRAQFAVVVQEFGPDGLTEAQNFFPAVARLPIRAQMAVMRVLIDEFGCGNLQQAHSHLYRELLAELGLPVELDELLPGTNDETFAFLNSFYWMASRAPHVEYFLGALAYLEASIPAAFAFPARACERLGLAHGRYYTEHIHIDDFHMKEMQTAIREHEAVHGVDATRLLVGARLLSGLLGAAVDAAVAKARS